MRRLWWPAPLLGIAVAGILVVSCSTSTPKIAQTFWQVNLVRNRDSGSTSEHLSFFVHVTDSEGLSDLDSIYLLNDASEVYWRLDSSNWQHREEDGELWVGSNFLQMPDGSGIPRGAYRVIVSNLAGIRATDSIFVAADHLVAARVKFPELVEKGASVEVQSSLSNSSVWLYNSKGDLVASRSVGAQPLELQGLLRAQKPPASMLTAYAYGYDKSCGCGLVNGPYEVGGPQ